MHIATGYIASHAVLAAALGAEEADKSVPIDAENLPVRRIQELATTGKTKIGRNEPCPCGSGKKFKKCEHFTDSRGAQTALLGMKLAAEAVMLRAEQPSKI